MNKKKYLLWQIALSVLFVSLFISCTEDFFDTETGGRIDPSQHYNSLIDAEASYAGCFVYLQDIAENLILVNGLRSDLMNVTENADRDMIDINLHELNANNPYVDPSNFYKLIININEVIPNLPQILALDRDFDSTYMFHLEGALVTLRSWAYYSLAKLNGEVGIVEGNLTTIDPSKPPEYLTKGQIVLRLISELLPYDDPQDIARYPVDHYVLLGELFMELNDFSTAAKYFKFAIDGPANRRVFMVGGDYAQEAWQDIFLNSSTQEATVRTAVPYSFVDGQKNMLEEWMNYKYDFMVKPADSLLSYYNSEIAQNDEIGDQFRGVGITYDTSATGIPFINKYSIDKGIPHSADVILYRAADIHLLLAEALNRSGNQSLALTLLNNGIGDIAGTKPVGYSKWSSNDGIRGRVYLKEKTIPVGTVDEMLYVEDLIIQERAMELAFEGKRWFDLVRIATRRGDPAYLADKVAAKFDDPAIAEAVRTKLMDPANWYLPIPKVGSN